MPLTYICCVTEAEDGEVAAEDEQSDAADSAVETADEQADADQAEADEEELDEVDLMLQLGIQLEEQLHNVEREGLPPHIVTR